MQASPAEVPQILAYVLILSCEFCNCKSLLPWQCLLAWHGMNFKVSSSTCSRQVTLTEMNERTTSGSKFRHAVACYWTQAFWHNECSTDWAMAAGGSVVMFYEIPVEVSFWKYDSWLSLGYIRCRACNKHLF